MKPLGFAVLLGSGLLKISLAVAPPLTSKNTRPWHREDRRYERDHAGELIHLDIKRLGRIGSVAHRITGRLARSIAIMALAGGSSMS